MRLTRLGVALAKTEASADAKPQASHENTAWESGDKVVIVTNGPAFTPVDGTYTVSGYKVTASTASLPIPEPTTATLSLLALAGLAARRR